MTEIIMQIEDIEETFTFGLQEQIGLRKGSISRYEAMTQKQADEINARMYYNYIKWVRVQDVGLKKCGLTRAQYEAVKK